MADGTGSGQSGRSGRSAGADEMLPETPHELPIDRGKVDALLDRVRQGEAVDLLEEFLAAVDWRRGFADDEGEPLALEELARLMEYYRTKFADVGPLYLAE